MEVNEDIRESKEFRQAKDLEKHSTVTVSTRLALQLPYRPCTLLCSRVSTDSYVSVSKLWRMIPVVMMNVIRRHTRKQKVLWSS